MNCPECEGITASHGMSGHPDTDRYWVCFKCYLGFYYANNKLYKWNPHYRKWIKHDDKEVVVFT